MEPDLRLVVMENGTLCTSLLARACQGSSIEVVRTVSDPRELAALEADVVVIDADEAGHLLRDVVTSVASAHVLALTANPSPVATSALVALGISGVLPITDDHRAIVDAIVRTARGELVVPDVHLSALLELSHLAHDLDEPADLVRTLTPREREVLTLLARGYSTSEVAASLSISDLTVRSHVKNILGKLGVHSKVEAVRYAWRSGACAVPIGA